MFKIVKKFQWIISLTLTVCAGYAFAQEEVSVPSLDGTTLNAWVFKAVQSQQTDLTENRVINPRPVVLALHGCGGLYASSGKQRGQLNLRHQAMGEMLQSQGYHVVFPDSFSARGEKSICVQPIGSRKITQRERRADALGTLDWVRQQAWADPKRVAVLGWSHGGSAVLAATDATHSQVSAMQRPPFAAAMAFYPGCADSLAKGYLANTDLTFFLGQDDDWTPPKPCIALAEQLQKNSDPTGKLVELNVYAGAVHDFDTPVAGVRERKEIPSRLHPGKGVMTGQNPQAREASWNRVKELLAKAFQ